MKLVIFLVSALVSATVFAAAAKFEVMIRETGDLFQKPKFTEVHFEVDKYLINGKTVWRGKGEKESILTSDLATYFLFELDIDEDETYFIKAHYGVFKNNLLVKSNAFAVSADSLEQLAAAYRLRNHLLYEGKVLPFEIEFQEMKWLQKPFESKAAPERSGI